MSMAGSSAAWMIPTMSYSRRKKVKGQQNGDEPQEDDWEEVSRVVDKATDALAVLENPDGPLRSRSDWSNQLSLIWIPIVNRFLTDFFLHEAKRV